MLRQFRGSRGGSVSTGNSAAVDWGNSRPVRSLDIRGSRKAVCSVPIVERLGGLLGHK